MAAIIQRYLAFVDRRPLAAKSMTAGALTAIGDVLAQQLERAKQPDAPPFDPMRTAKFAGWGLGVGGPFMHYWYRYLDTRLGNQGVKVALKKVALDQFVLGPPSLVLFFTYMGLSQGHSYQEIGQKMKESYWPTMFANWAVWPAVQAVNFSLLPPNGRVLFVSLVAIGWNTFLSHQGSK